MPFSCVLLQIILFQSYMNKGGGEGIYSTWANNYYFISALCFHLDLPTMIATWSFLAFIFTFINKNEGVLVLIFYRFYWKNAKGGKVLWHWFGSFFRFFQFLSNEWFEQNIVNLLNCNKFMAKQNNMLSLLFWNFKIN